LPERPLVNAALCSYCHEKPAYAKALCKSCYGRFLKTGSAKKVEKKKLNVNTIKYKLEKIDCVSCGTLFQPLRKTQKHCSRKCYDHDHRRQQPIQKICENQDCGKAFETTKKRQRFCTEYCKIAYFNAARKKRNKEVRVCEICKRHFTTVSYHGKYCSYECQRKSEPFKVGKRKHELSKKFNLTVEEYEKMLEAQEGKCAICGEKETMTRNGKEPRLSVDHDHKTGKVRGLLCNSCNNGLGRFKDDTDLIKKAIAYLTKSLPAESHIVVLS